MQPERPIEAPHQRLNAKKIGSVRDAMGWLSTMQMLMTSDGLRSYVSAITESFGYGATYAQTVKSYHGG